MTTDTPLNLNKPTMDLADLRHRPVQSITASTLSKELQEDSLRSHLDDLRKELAASKAEVEKLCRELAEARSLIIEGKKLHDFIRKLLSFVYMEMPTHGTTKKFVQQYFNEIQS
jgi:hypothetical protein